MDPTRGTAQQALAKKRAKAAARACEKAAQSLAALADSEQLDVYAVADVTTAQEAAELVDAALTGSPEGVTVVVVQMATHSAGSDAQRGDAQWGSTPINRRSSEHRRPSRSEASTGSLAS